MHRYIPFGLLLAFGVKFLFTGIDTAGVAVIAALGITSFFLEKFIENNNMLAMKQRQDAQDALQKKQAEELETVKSYVSSLRLSGARNGLSRTAQQ